MESFTIVKNPIKKKCPKCGWKNNDWGHGAGLFSVIEGANGDWCARCLILKCTEGIPQMEEIKNT